MDVVVQTVLGNIRSKNPTLRFEGLQMVSKALAFGDPNFIADC
jgi:hypothetical protein